MTTSNPHKRRRIIHASLAASKDADDLLPNIESTNDLNANSTRIRPSDAKSGGVTVGQTNSYVVGMSSSCVSCKRALSSARSGIVICARYVGFSVYLIIIDRLTRVFPAPYLLWLIASCQRPSCGICSRRCTRSIPSYPPTPHLSFSPTPTPSPTISTRRLALSTNTHTLNSEDTPKKRKISPGGYDSDEMSRENIRTVLNSIGRSKLDDCGQDSPASADSEHDGGYSEGCGRTFCKACCYEDAEAVTCLWCNGSRINH
ncbi:hypothetical protein ONZ45_g6800 [Pleurotus djamor]|nr:hypothetical protein ONZ45_g6800 [Pleurotus djamor]